MSHKTYHNIAMPWPSGLLFGNWTVTAKTLAELRKATAKTGEKIRVTKTSTR